MSLFLALSAFLTTAAGVYLVTDRSYFRVILGVGFLGHATNLVVLSAGRWKPDAPVVDPAVTASTMTDPLPHALLLTAIVISMAVTIYLLALMVASAKTTGVVAVAPAPENDGDTPEAAIHGELTGANLERDLSALSGREAE